MAYLALKIVIFYEMFQKIREISKFVYFRNFRCFARFFENSRNLSLSAVTRRKTRIFESDTCASPIGLLINILTCVFVTNHSMLKAVNEKDTKWGI